MSQAMEVEMGKDRNKTKNQLNKRDSATTVTGAELEYA